MLFVLLVSNLLCVSLSSPLPKEQSLWVREGTNVTACCTIQPRSGVDALLINVNGRRFAAMLGSPPNVRRIDSRDQRTIEELPEWKLDDMNKDDTALCVHDQNGSGLSSIKPVEIHCIVRADGGLGKIVEEELILVKVYTPVVIHANAEPTTVVEGQQAVLTCQATGSPGLHLKWKPKLGDTVLNETEVDQQQGSEGRLDLILDNVRATQHGEVYVCEAKTNYPKNVAPARAEFVLNVALPPTINASTSTIHTDLNAPEELNITVAGYPVPDVSCEDLELDSGTQVATEPQGGVMLYRLHIPRIQEVHLRRYICKAVNAFGEATLPVEFTVAPSNPEVLSPSQTKYADYYLLKWKTRSGAPLVNVTLNIDEYNEEESSGSLYPRAVENKTVAGHRSHTLALNSHELDRMKVDIWPSPDAPIADSSAENNTISKTERERTVWHHLTNLSANTEHRLTVTVCNEYACGESEPYEFHTNRNQLVDTKFLRLSPRDAEQVAGQIAASSSNSNPNQSPIVRVSTIHTPLIMISVPFLVRYVTQLAC